MKEILYKRYKKYKKLIKTAIGFILFLCFSFFFQINQKPVNALNNRVIIPIKQEFETDNENVDGVFTYTLEAKDKDNPMPLNSNGINYTWSMKNDSNINLSFDINKVGDFTYSINQDYQHDDEGHFAIDHHIYKLNIQSHYDKNNEIVATAVVRNQDGNKVSEIIFKNYYKMHSTIPPKRKPTNGNTPVINDKTGNQEVYSKTNKSILRTGDSSLIESYFFMFIVSGVVLLLMNHAMKKKGDADND